MKRPSTKEVARKIGIGRSTLERWLASGKLRQPRSTEIGGSRFRHWTDADIEKVLKYKQKNYRKGRGRRKDAAKREGK